MQTLHCRLIALNQKSIICGIRCFRTVRNIPEDHHPESRRSYVRCEPGGTPACICFVLRQWHASKIVAQHWSRAPTEGPSKAAVSPHCTRTELPNACDSQHHVKGTTWQAAAHTAYTERTPPGRKTAGSKQPPPPPPQKNPLANNTRDALDSEQTTHVSQYGCLTLRTVTTQPTGIPPACQFLSHSDVQKWEVLSLTDENSFDLHSAGRAPYFRARFTDKTHSVRLKRTFLLLHASLSSGRHF
jgi:hypothetical protein